MYTGKKVCKGFLFRWIWFNRKFFSSLVVCVYPDEEIVVDEEDGNDYPTSDNQKPNGDPRPVDEETPDDDESAAFDPSEDITPRDDNENYETTVETPDDSEDVPMEIVVTTDNVVTINIYVDDEESPVVVGFGLKSKLHFSL